MIIRIKRKNVYGNELIYPLDQVEALGRLTGKKTLDESDIKCLQALDVEVVDIDKIVEVLSN